MNHPNRQRGFRTAYRMQRDRLLPRLFLLLSMFLAWAGGAASAGAQSDMARSRSSADDATSGKPALRESYNRHFVVLVDQTVFFQHSHAAMCDVYRGLRQWLTGQKSLSASGLDQSQTSCQAIAPFDEQHDQLSVFAFALKGTGTGNGKGQEMQRGTPYAQVNAMSRGGYANADVYDRLARYFITPQGDFRHSGGTFEHFCKEKFYPLFSGDSRAFADMKDVGAISLSYYAYPLIFDRLQESTPAKQVILVVVSDFNSGSFNENASQDEKQLYTMLGNRNDRFDYVLQRVENLKQPYTQVELAHIVAKHDGRAVVAKATALVVKESVMHSPLFIESNLALTQQGTGTTFRLSEADVSFNKSDSIQIDDVEIVVSSPSGVLCSHRLSADERQYDAAKHQFRIAALDLAFPSSYLGDELRVTYNFYTHSQAGGESLLPFLYTAERTIDSDSIFYTNVKLQRYTHMILITLLVIVILLTLLYLGRKKNIALRIGNFTQKFTNVTAEHGAEELPCWFYTGPTDTTRRIRLDGRLGLAHRLGLPVTSAVSIRLQNLQPAPGFTCYVNGRQLTNEWTPVKKEGRNAFSVVLNLQANTALVNPDDLTTVSADIDVRIDSSVFGLWRHTDVDTSHQLRFFFTHDRGTAWVGFDPGTTGSCVAYGNTGGTLDDPAIRLVKDEYGQSIIPSFLALDTNFGQRAIQDLRPGEDYKYGSQADVNARAWRNKGTPVFRSIKKLLGYQNQIEVNIGNMHRRFRGVDLAHLLVKGLQCDLRYDIKQLSSADRQRYLGQAQEAQRAVVAIPNNYTLPKILDMVNSVRRLTQFKEVRFVYEAEAVLFNYLSKNFAKQQPGEETIMVYDMGGATINVTVFRVHYIERGGTIYYHVETLGRIGYGVGGDNIDVALMEHALLLDSVKGLGKDVVKRRRLELAHKEQILGQILELKKAIIDCHDNGANKNNPLLSHKSFQSFMNDGLLKGTKCSCQMDEKEEKSYSSTDMCDDFIHSEELFEFVYANIDDVVSEILHYPEVGSLHRIDTIIFSGRSTLFPGVKYRVQTALGKHFGQQNTPHMHPLDKDDVKRAVAYGACWYGIYNSLVTLDNSRLSSAYGFKFTTQGHAGLEVLLRQNCRFGEDGCISATSRRLDSAFAADGNQVNFYQIMGSGQGDNLFSAENRHKVNYIGTLPATTVVENVSMSVTCNNIVTCEVLYDNGGQMAVNNIQVQGRDITDENDWAYVFATSAQTDDDIPDSMLHDSHPARERRAEAQPHRQRDAEPEQPKREAQKKSEPTPPPTPPKAPEPEPKTEPLPNYVPETKPSRMPNPKPQTKPYVPKNINRL